MRGAQLCPDVVEPHGVTVQTGDDLAQARRPDQLAVEQRQQLALGDHSANPRISPMRRHQAVKLAPRQMLQKPMKNAIVIAHGVDPVSGPDTSAKRPNRVELLPCPLATKTQPDSRGTWPGIHVLETGTAEPQEGVDGRTKPGHWD